MPNPVQRRHRSAVLSGGQFRPPDIGNLKAWWLPNRNTWQDSAQTTPAVADSDPVGGWVDTVGGFAATQATAGARPLLKLNVFGNMPALLFTAASSQYLIADSLASTFSGVNKPLTFICIYKVTSLSAAVAWCSLARLASATPYLLFQTSATNSQSMQRKDDAAVVDTVSGAVTGTTAPECVATTYDGTFANVYLGGNQRIGTATFTSTTLTCDEFSIGVWRRINTTLASLFGGHIAELAVYQSALTAAQILQWSQYANRTYGAALR
jgi:hypothetical protein